MVPTRLLSSLISQGVVLGKAEWTALVLVVFISACTTSGMTVIPASPSPEVRTQQADPVGIPNEYIPAPGKCRIWYPDRSPDKQPPPERCLEIYDVPAGAWVVYGGPMIKTYRIEEYDPERPGVVTFINYFELESGRFLRRERVCE